MFAIAPQNQRASERIAVRLAVTATSEHNFFTGFTENVSEGGLFVSTESPAPVGTVIELIIDLPQVGHNLKVKGEVRWFREPMDLDVPRGMGLQFVDIEASDAKILQRYVDDVREALFFDEE